MAGRSSHTYLVCRSPVFFYGASGLQMNFNQRRRFLVQFCAFTRTANCGIIKEHNILCLFFCINLNIVVNLHIFLSEETHFFPYNAQYKCTLHTQHQRRIQMSTKKTNVITSVIKRSGEEVDFDVEKIVNAIKKANQRSRQAPSAERLSDPGHRR